MKAKKQNQKSSASWCEFQFSRFNFPVSSSTKRGFSLLEILLVLGIIAVLGSTSIGIYRNFVKNVELKTVTQGIRADLKTARSKAQAGEENYKWGIRFANSTQDYYEVFSTPTDYADAGKQIRETIYLRGGVTFSNPTESNNKDVIFARISGTTTEATITAIFDGQAESVSVGATGAVN